MCGIAGKLLLASDDQVSRPEIQAMLDPLSHRGPDGQGIYLDGPVGLGHLRLSIIDLGTGGQPMSNEDDSVWIVFNGEIYNYQELRARLLAQGHVFRSHSDTEVIIHLYEQMGPECVRDLRGMFAFAIWDARRRRLFIARDRVGIKPLYYCQTAQALWFASELKGIMAEPSLSREVDAGAVAQFLSFHYVPGEATLFRSVKKLLPGHTLVAEGGKVSIRQYWDLQFNDSRWSKSFEEVVEELNGLIKDTVREHMMADVPVGVLLSGGVDSSAVLSFAVEGTAKKVKTFTVGFDGSEVVDERPFARLVAQRFGTEHYDLSITAQDFWDFLPSYIWHMEEPVCEPPAVALYYVSKLAAQYVKVLLSGEGGDEAFAGYPNYPNMLWLDGLCRKLGPLARPAGGLASAIGAASGREQFQRFGYALGRPLAAHYFSRTSGPTAFFHESASQFLTPEFRRAAQGVSPERTMAELLQPVRGQSLLNQMLYADTKTWLPDDLLVKADKITMANSLELRVPLLDHKVLEFAASLRQEHKVLGRDTKRALKAAFAKVLPTEVLTRKKAGFPVPYAQWLRRGLAAGVREILLSTKAQNRGYFQPGRVSRLLDANERTGQFSKEVFCLLALELWHRQFTDGPQAASLRPRMQCLSS